MPIVKSGFKTPILHELEFLVPKEDYEKFKNRILEQLLSRVEVPGYRPGKAPMHKLLQSVDEEKVERVVFQETVQKFGQEAVKSAHEEILKENAKLVIVNTNMDQKNSKVEEDGFHFVLVTKLLPDVNVLPLLQAKIDPPTEEDIELPKLEEFREKEVGRILSMFNEFEETDAKSAPNSKLIVNLEGKIEGKVEPGLGGKNQEILLGYSRYLPDFEKNLTGLKAGDEKEFKITFPKDYHLVEFQNKEAEFKVEVLQVLQAKYATIEELYEKSSNETLNALSNNKEDLIKKIDEVYKSNVEKALNDKLRRTLIRKVIELVPEFPLPEDDINAEKARIKENIIAVSKKDNLSLEEVVKINGLEFNEKKAPKKDEDLDPIVENYVVSEYRLSVILNYIYQNHVDEKDRPSKDELEAIAKEMVTRPNEYSLPSGITLEETRQEAQERAARNIALDWVTKQVIKTKE